MAETIKSALFVDYDSLHRRLALARPEAASHLAERAGAWVAAIESGRLVNPKPEAGTRRRILIRRCYANPELLGSNRAAFIASGFEVVDCPLQEGRHRNPADIHIVLDTIDALDHPTGYQEFILLSADADLTPVLLRLRAHNRSTLIYATASTAANYKAIADGVLDEGPLVSVLLGEEEPQPAPPPAATIVGRAGEAPPAPLAAADRNSLEALARKVHAVTNVPLFSPRTYAELFRHIAQEIAERGYHFQNTAENVTEKLTAAGRNVSRRQVLFVVKGLALKGHVFSTTDTPEQLAEVFREQVLYLIGNTELKLDESERALMPSWIVGRVTAAQAAAEPVAERPGAAQPKPAKRRAAKPVPPPRQPAAPPPVREVQAREPIARPAPAPSREPPQPAARAPQREPEPIVAEAPPAPQPPPQQQPAPQRSVPAGTKRLDEIRAAAAARLAALGKAVSSATATPKPAQPAPAQPAPAPQKQARPAQRLTSTDDEPNKEELESSILAAIAQAVDVLVEDGNAPPRNGQQEETESPPTAAEPAAPPPEPQPSEGGDSDDIGDEIQRIIASYSRARQQGETR